MLMRTWIWLVVVIGAVGAARSTDASDRIYNLIQAGDLTTARELLSDAASTDRDGARLFATALLEPDAATAERLLRAALDAGLSERYRQEAQFRLVQLAHWSGHSADVRREAAAYTDAYPQGRYRPAVDRLVVAAYERDGDYDRAVQTVDRYLARHGRDTQLEQWGTVDKARLFQSRGKSIGALRQLRKLAESTSGVGIAPALYLLTTDAAVSGNTDRAVFYYNLLREEHPNAIGLDRLIDRIAGLADPTESEDARRAEELTGTWYTIQVGVFSNPDNAQRLADDLKRFDQQVSVGRKTISGKTYRVVTVGRFTSYLAAAQFKETMERQTGELYQVVTK